MAMDLNDAPEQREFGVIPDGTFVRLKGNIRPGGHNLPGAEQIDANLFKHANPPSDAIMLDWEFTVMHGPHARQKLWQMTTVTGGSLDEKGQSKAGNISKAMFRAMIDSALGLDPKDMSEPTKAKRVLRGFADLDGIEFAARVGVEKGGINNQTGGQYADKNRIAHVVVPGEPEWQAVMSGQEVAPKPTGAVTPRQGATGAQQQQKPAWQRDAAPATAATPAMAVQPAGAPSPAWQNGAVQPQPAAAPQAATPAAAGPAWLRG